MNFVESKLKESFSDQVQPFVQVRSTCEFSKGKDIFNVTMEDHFDGTLFRLPLRTESLAKDSLISQDSYMPSSVLQVIVSKKPHFKLKAPQRVFKICRSDAPIS